jgi:hypothetical protein
MMGDGVLGLRIADCGLRIAGCDGAEVRVAYCVVIGQSSLHSGWWSVVIRHSLFGVRYSSFVNGLRGLGVVAATPARRMA